MALLDVKMRSECLGKDVSVNVLLPEISHTRDETKVLWLLHGMRHDYSSMHRLTNIEHYTAENNVCVIMPGADLSYYTDMVYGGKYYTYITHELPEKLSRMLNISTQRECNYIAGLSMGGYGAFKAALNNPEKYIKAASMSGVLDLEQMYDIRSFDKELMHCFDLVFGSRESFKKSINDLIHMTNVKKDNNELPKLYMCCGSDDFLYGINNDFKKHLDNLNIPVLYEQDENCSHNWSYWDKKIKRILDWMDI